MRRLVILAVIALFLLPAALAYNGYKLKIASPGCQFSLNDDAYGAWDAAANKGVFMTVTDTSTAQYPSTPTLSYSYTPVSKTSVNRDAVLLNLNSPIIYTMYMKCTLDVGQNIPAKTRFCAMAGSATSEFGLNKDANLNGKTPLIFSWYYPNTTYNVPTTFSLLPGTRTFECSNNLTKFPPLDLGSSSAAIQTEGAVYALDSIYLKNVYLDSKSRMNIQDYVLPEVDASQSSVKDMAGNVLIHPFYLAPGTSLRITYKLRNPYLFPINNVRYSYYINTGIQNLFSPAPGISYATGYYPVEISTPTGPMVSLNPGSSTDLEFVYTAPLDSANKVYPDAASLLQMGSAEPSGKLLLAKGYLYSQRLGTDAMPVLMFKNLSAEIHLVNDGTDADPDYNPYFNLTVGMFNYGGGGSYNAPPGQTFTIHPPDPSIEGDHGDYSVIFQLFKQSNNQKVGADTVTDIDSPLLARETKMYEMRVQIKDLLPDNYYVKMFTRKNTGRFAGKNIAQLSTKPTFKAGALQYTPSGQDYAFDFNTREVTKKVTLFNPDFYPHTLTLEVTDTPGSDFDLDDVADSFNLGPLEVKDVDVKVTASPSNWFSSSTDSFKLRVSSNQAGANPTEINYNLRITAVEPDNSREECRLKFGKSDSEIPCSSEGETHCWDTVTSSASEAQCCGDDGSDECWMDNDDRACCNKFIIDADANEDSCKGMRSVRGISGDIPCNSPDENYCWRDNKCCGDDTNEDWITLPTTISKLEDLPSSTCYHSAWLSGNGFYYKLTR